MPRVVGLVGRLVLTGVALAVEHPQQGGVEVLLGHLLRSRGTLAEPERVVEVRYEDGEVAVDVENDGRTDGAADGDGMGLVGMRERVAALKVTCALTEPQFDLDLVQTVFEGHDLKTAVVDPAGSGIPLGPDMYPDLIRSVGTALASCN